MTRRPRAIVLLSGVVPTLLTAALCLYRPTVLANLEYGVYDTVVRAARKHPPGGRIAIVDVDDRSLSAIGQWPWRREVMGRLIARLRDLGASAIALDIIFAESETREGAGAGTDTSLADTLRKGRVVMGYAMTFDRTPGGSSACVQHPLSLAIVRRGSEEAGDPFFRATGAVCNLPNLTTAAGVS